MTEADVVIAGHNHFYDRMYKGINYVTTGGGGATYLDGSTIYHDPTPVSEDQKLASEMRVDKSELDGLDYLLSSYHEWFHYCLVSISSDDNTAPSVSVYDKDDNLIDEFTVTEWDQVVGGSSQDWRYWTRHDSDFPNNHWKKWDYDEAGWVTGFSCRMGYNDYDIDTDLRTLLGGCGSPGDWNLYYYFRQPFYVSGTVTKAELLISRDDPAWAYIAYEGQGGDGFTEVFMDKVGKASHSREISFKRIDLTSYLQVNTNHVLSVKVEQIGASDPGPGEDDVHFDAVLLIKY